MKDPFERGFPQDLPLRPSTSAHFDWQARSRNLFDLRLPESLQALNTGILTMPIREHNALNWSWQETFLQSRLFIENKLFVQARFTPDEGCVHLELEVQNLSAGDWQETQAVVCTRLISAPDFCDTRRERTSWWDGEWHPLDRGFPHVALQPSRAALITVESDPPGYVFGLGWPDVWSVGGNDMLHNVCVHSDPRIGDIAAGAGKKVKGIVIFTAGDRREALKRFLSSLSIFWNT